MIQTNLSVKQLKKLIRTVNKTEIENENQETEISVKKFKQCTKEEDTVESIQEGPMHLETKEKGIKVFKGTKKVLTMKIKKDLLDAINKLLTEEVSHKSDRM